MAKTTSDAAANYVLIVILKVPFKKCYLDTYLNPVQILHTNQEWLRTSGSKSEIHAQIFVSSEFKLQL